MPSARMMQCSPMWTPSISSATRSIVSSPSNARRRAARRDGAVDVSRAQTYAQGAAAEITAMATIGAADAFGLPVSTTHVLSSGVAGTMAANHSGLQWSTVRNLLMAWVLTLPASIVLAAFLFWGFRRWAG